MVNKQSVFINFKLILIAVHYISYVYNIEFVLKQITQLVNYY